MYETFKIKHKNSTAYKPQMNAAIKAANKNIKKILRKMIEKHKKWHEKLSFALLGYRPTVRTSTRANPYMLVYGTEAVIPTKWKENECSLSCSALSEQNVQSLQQKSQAKTIHTRATGAKENLSTSR
ncbi:uncharacterized protein [Nicotiana sylvestris]|uniref:uncharacterized protein n=1 Tax=Nicotiana sylvestris TaxID=4096 RepID=UPI00388C9255